MALKSTSTFCYLFISSLFFVACQTEFTESPTYSDNSPTLGYKVFDPFQEWTLDQDLEEISAIACWNQNAFLAIEDEHGILYHLDKEGHILQELPFAEDGDFEGLCIAKEDIWIARSDGTLFQLSNWQYWNPDILKVQVYKTELSSENNLEGICYDADQDNLLLACKGNPLIKETTDKNIRTIFRFGLKENKLYPNPAFTIQLKDFQEYLVNDKGFLKPEDFAPSDIAIHPQTREIYIPSNKAHLILVLQADGNFSKIYPLLPQIYEQVEGICFDLDANMYCSSEGNKAAAKLWQFRYERLQ